MTGLYLEAKSMTGQEIDDITYKKFMLDFDETKWQPPLSNQCLMLPHDDNRSLTPYSIQ